MLGKDLLNCHYDENAELIFEVIINNIALTFVSVKRKFSLLMSGLVNKRTQFDIFV